MINELSLNELRKKILSKEISITETTQSHIEQIEKVNPKINAVVEKTYDKALNQARAFDDGHLKGEINQRDQSLFGLPFTIKEMISVQGLKQTVGSIHRRDFIANSHSTVYSRLKKSGAILLGTTNVPELGLWYECDNVVYGKTSCPYDIKRTSGGSSGGEAAIVSSLGSTFGIGSDVGGSIRIPASFCGLFGHKPTEGVIPITGHYPYDSENFKEFQGDRRRFTVVGPMTRKAEDLITLFNVLAGPDQFDSIVKAREWNFLPRSENQNWKDKKVFILPRPRIHLCQPPTSEVQDVIKKAGKHFESLGAQVEEASERLFNKAFKLWSARMIAIQDRSFKSALSGRTQLSYLQEFSNIAFGKPKYTFPALLTAFLQEQEKKLPLTKKDLLGELQALHQEIENLLGPGGILLMPTHPRVAFKHGQGLLHPFDWAYTGIINALNLPATAVPMGLNKEGLPLGLQVIGRSWEDDITINAALNLEEAFGGHIPPKMALS